MSAMTRERVRHAIRHANRHGYNLHNTVSSQLFEIANSQLGAARMYWSDRGQEETRSKPWEWTPNQPRDTFVTSVRAALAERVDHAYMLPPEQRFAAETFRVLADYAEQTDWDKKEGFEKVWSAYDGSRELIEYRLDKARKAISDLRLERAYLMGKKGLPYKPVAL